MKDKIEDKKSIKDYGVELLPASSDNEETIRKMLRVRNGDESDFEIKRFWVAKDGETVVGCIRTKVFKDGGLELSSLVVECDYQNKGIGSSLVEKILKKEKVRPIYLLTSEAKKGFYEKFGFDEIESSQVTGGFKKEYDRVRALPFAKGIKIVAMQIG